MLKVKNLQVSVGEHQIINGVNLEVQPGELHVLMGPNGSGKSTLAQVIAGHPSYKVDPPSQKLRRASSSPITFNGADLTKLTSDKRAKLGIFLGFQHPVEVPGVSVFNFLRRARSARSERWNLESSKGSSSNGSRIQGSTLKQVQGATLNSFRQELLEYASSLRLTDDILRRSLNEGFSGGEKKRNEILQMMALSPKLAILDEIDSGLDVDGLKLIAKAIKQFTVNSSQSSVILITHYARILKYLKPDFVHVMVDGRIVKSGKMSLAKKIEEKGYQGWQMV